MLLDGGNMRQFHILIFCWPHQLQDVLPSMGRMSFNKFGRVGCCWGAKKVEIRCILLPNAARRTSEFVWTNHRVVNRDSLKFFLEHCWPRTMWLLCMWPFNFWLLNLEVLYFRYFFRWLRLLTRVPCHPLLPTPLLFVVPNSSKSWADFWTGSVWQVEPRA